MYVYIHICKQILITFCQNLPIYMPCSRSFRTIFFLFYNHLWNCILWRCRLLQRILSRAAVQINFQPIPTVKLNRELLCLGARKCIVAWQTYLKRGGGVNLWIFLSYGNLAGTHTQIYDCGNLAESTGAPVRTRRLPFPNDKFLGLYPAAFIRDCLTRSLFYFSFALSPLRLFLTLRLSRVVRHRRRNISWR